MITQEQIGQVLEGLNEAEKKRLNAEGYTNECFFNEDGSLTQEYTWHSHDKKKYFYLDLGSSEVFMIDKTQAVVFKIKAYGQKHNGKCFNFEFENLKAFGEAMHKRRW